jgi:KaiC/GvpD/RAD55 family RecA-like ATPase
MTALPLPPILRRFFDIDALPVSTKTVLIYGEPGSGKTSLASQIAVEFVNHCATPVLYYNTDEPSEAFQDLRSRIRPLDELRELATLRLGPIALRKAEGPELEDFTEMLATLREAAILEQDTRRVLIIDSINNIESGLGSSFPTRSLFRRFRSLSDGLLPHYPLCIFISEAMPSSGFNLSHAVDIVIRCRHRGDGGAKSGHFVAIEKARRMRKPFGEHLMEIDAKGVSVSLNLAAIAPATARLALSESSFYRTRTLLDPLLMLGELKGIPQYSRVYIEGPPLTKKFHLALNIISSACFTQSDAVANDIPAMKKLIVSFHANESQIRRELRKNATEMLQLPPDDDENSNPSHAPIRAGVVEGLVEVLSIPPDPSYPARVLFDLQRFILARQDEGVLFDVVAFHDFAELGDGLSDDEEYALMSALLSLSNLHKWTPIIVHTTRGASRHHESYSRMMDCIFETGFVGVGEDMINQPFVRLAYFRPGKSFPNWYQHIEATTEGSIFKVTTLLDSYVQLSSETMGIRRQPLFVHLPNTHEESRAYFDDLSKSLAHFRVTDGDQLAEIVIHDFEDLQYFYSNLLSYRSFESGSRIIALDEFWFDRFRSSHLLEPITEWYRRMIPGWPMKRIGDWYPMSAFGSCFGERDVASTVCGIPLWHNPSLWIVDRKRAAEEGLFSDWLKDDPETVEFKPGSWDLLEQLVSHKSGVENAQQDLYFRFVTKQDIVCFWLDLFADYLFDLSAFADVEKSAVKLLESPKWESVGKLMFNLFNARPEILKISWR